MCCLTVVIVTSTVRLPTKPRARYFSANVRPRATPTILLRPAPRRGRTFLATRDQRDPATLPTLQAASAAPAGGQCGTCRRPVRHLPAASAGPCTGSSRTDLCRPPAGASSAKRLRRAHRALGNQTREEVTSKPEKQRAEEAMTRRTRGRAPPTMSRGNDRGGVCVFASATVSVGTEG